MEIKKEKVDFLIIGSGIAGLRAAISASKYGDVIILTKSKIDEGSTAQAQGGVAVALSPLDKIKWHFADTIAVGDGLCDPDAVWILTNEGPERISELIRWGTKFDMADKKLYFSREGAHRVERIIHSKDATGHEIEQSLIKKIKSIKNIQVIENIFTIDLIKSKDQINGAIAVTGNNLFYFFSRAVVLATGGCGQVYKNTTNPLVSTGDGIAMATRVGAPISDMEFTQFHPTALAIDTYPKFLISEAVRGEGGVLINHKNEPFMKDYHPMGDLAPRDVVARAIHQQMEKYKLKNVYLDISFLNANRIKERFPSIYKFCLKYNIDITSEAIPVFPAMHYIIGGVKTDFNGKTLIKNLFACGEVANVGIHGANRLASNSLLEGIVFSARVGEYLKNFSRFGRRENIKTDIPDIKFSDKKLDDRLIEIKESIKNLMEKEVGIIRNKTGLTTTLKRFKEYSKYLSDTFIDPQCQEIKNILEVATLITKFALIREESRGVHFRSDFPYKDDINWKKHIVLRE